jgi:hypothetical protein
MTEQVQKIERFFSDEFLSSLQSRIDFIKEEDDEPMVQIGDWVISPGLYDDLLHHTGMLRKVREWFENDTLVPSICSGNYYPKSSDMPLSTSDEMMRYQVVIQLTENEDWGFKYYSNGELESIILGAGEVVAYDSSNLMVGRCITSTDQGQVTLCYVEGDSPHRLAGINNISKSSYLKYRNRNESRV